MSVKTKKKTDREDITTADRLQVYIKKIILENFLSFQKDEVQFDESRFIVVVGPNWSGKSSIFQAIKFALGSNARDERYGKWSSFIRHGQDHAMIEIHIQNGDELIQIRRTVIRGSSPSFSIRKGDGSFRKVQATIIQKLVNDDLKYNPDNQFAFVSQGKIDAIKNLKPKELCVFLEEGMGLLDLRSEILREKKNVLNLENDLRVLITRKNSLNINLELLRPKLERLEKKKELLKIKETYMDELLWANRNKLQDEIEKLKTEINDIQVIIDSLIGERDAINNEVAKFQDEIREVDGEINALSETLGEKNYIKRDLAQQVLTWQQDKIKKKERLDVLNKQIEKNTKILNNYKNQQRTLKKEYSIINESKVNTEKDIDDLIKEQNDLASKIKLNEEFSINYNRLLSQKGNKLNRIQDNDAEIKIKNDLINQLFQSLKDIDYKLEQNKWFLENPANDQLPKFKRQLRKIETRLLEVDDETRQLEIDKSRKLKKFSRLKGSLNNRRVELPSEIISIKDEIEKIPSLRKVKGPLLEYLSYDDELSYAIESVLGEYVLFGFIAENWDTFRMLTNLKKKYHANCNIYVTKKDRIRSLSKVSAKGALGYLADLIKVNDNDMDVKKIIYSIAKNCMVVEDYSAGRALYSSINFHGKSVTLTGEQIVSYDYAYESPYQKRLRGFLSAGTQKEHIKLLESEIRNLGDRLAELQVEASRYDKEQREILKKQRSFDDLLYAFNQRKRLTDKKNSLFDQRASLAKNNEALKHEIKELEIKIKVMKSQQDPNFFKWNDRIKEIPDELNKKSEVKKTWDNKLTENQALMKEVEDHIMKVKSTHDMMELEFKMKKEAFQKEDKKAFKIYRQIEDLEDEIDTLKDAIINLNGKKDKIQETRSELDKKLNQIDFSLKQENVRLSTASKDLNRKREDLKRIMDKLGAEKKKGQTRPIEEIEKDIYNMDKELFEYQDVDETVLVQKDHIMGSLKEISKSQKDLERDIKAAIKTEKKLEEIYYNRFEIVLNELESKVNQKFQTSKVKMYCSLVLSGDFEELGVEIKAATSKKLLKECTALSGGQVSMVSIGLILSLQEIKPSPLCMFDEAGMFLDDKNSEITYKLIKSTLAQNPIQMIMFLPKSPNSLFNLAEKLIGVARTGKDDVSTIFIPKIVMKED